MKLILPLAVFLALTVPAGASECVPTTSVTDHDTIVVDSGHDISLIERYYVYDLCNVPTVHTDRESSITIFATRVSAPVGVTLGECVFSIWTYYETNGIEGLQRGDEMHDDTCGGLIESDSIPF